jgi:hypothetical protein
VTDQPNELDESIEDLQVRYAAAPAGSPAAARLANDLGRQLTMRYFRHGGAPADRDQAIELLDEALSVPHDAAVTHAGISMLLFFRAMPIPVGGDPDGSAGVALGMALMSGTLNDPGRLADRDRALGHLRWIVEHEPPDAPVRHHAQAMIAALRLVGASGPAEIMAAVASLAEVAGSLGGKEQALVELLQRCVEPADAPRLRTAYDEVLRQLPAGHRLRPLILAEAGALLAERGHVADLPEHLTGLAGVLRDTLADLRGDDPLYGQTVRRLAGLLLSATAYTGDPEGIAQIVRLADDLVTDAEGAGRDPVTAGKDRFLRAMALTLRGRFGDHPAADLRAAAEDLQVALATVPADDDLRPAIAGMLGALLNDRHLRQGVRDDADAGAKFLAGALASLERAGGSDRTVIELAGLMSRTVLAVQQREAAQLDQVIDGLEASLTKLDAGYPWRSRLDAGLGLAYLTRASLTHRPDDLRTGVTLLHKAGGDLAVEVSGRPALRAAGALGALLDGLLDEDRAAVAVAAQRLDEVVGDASVPLPDRVALTTLRAQVAMIRYADGRRQEDLRAAVDGFDRVRYELLADQPAHPLAAQVHTGLATALRSAGRFADSVDSGLQALRAYGNDVLLQTGTAHALDAARHAAGLARQIADWCLDDGRPERALEAVELGRGLVLHSAMAGTTVSGLLRTGGHLDLAAEWEAAPAAPGPVGTAAAVVEQVTAELVSVPSDLRPRVLAALHGSGVAGQLSAAPGLPQIAAAAREVDADAVVYLLAGSAGRPGRLLVVTADAELRCPPAPQLRLDAPELIDYLAAHDDRMARTSVARWRERLGTVCEWAWPALIEPLLTDLGDPDEQRPHRLVLVPADSLGYVPWHAARTGSRYACEPFALSYAASARQLGAVARRPRAPEGPVTLVADPTADLLWAASEIKALREGLYPRALVLGATEHADGVGTPDEVLRSLAGDPGPAVLHLACHASTGATPDSSHLVLAGESQLSVARILAAAQHRPAGAPGGLVVLSACASDLTTSAYDEALTLATALLAAGAVSVVGSRWPVNDRTTACLMVMFHRYRTVDGLGDRDALRATYLWMLDPHREVPPELVPLGVAGRFALADPTAWAPFTHHGR